MERRTDVLPSAAQYCGYTGIIVIRALIIKGRNNHMPPMTSNHGGYVNKEEASTEGKKGL